MKTILSIFIIIIIGISPSFAQDVSSYSRLKIYLDEQHSLQNLLALGVACDHGQPHQQRHFIHDFSDYEEQLIRQAGFRFEVLIEDVIAYYQQQNQPKKTTPNNQCVPTPPIDYPIPTNFNLGSMGGYLTYQELIQNLDSMVSKFPHLISPRVAIDSNNLTHEGRMIYWVKISDNPQQDEAEPEVLYNALHHAREPMSMMQLVYYMWYLLENYQANPEIRHLVNETELYFVPCINPDGYIYNESMNPQGGGLWRKNRRNNGDGTFGVDLNRNYGYAWGINNQGSSPTTASDIYRGTQAFSEPETQNIRDFCQAHAFELVLNYHSYGNAVLYPWGHLNQLTPDSTLYKQYARVMTQENDYVAGINRNILGYSTNGDADDWMYGEQVQKNKMISFTPEVSSGGFWMPATAIVPTCQQVVWQNITAAQLVQHYGVLETRNEVVAKQITYFTKYELTRYGQQNGTFTVQVQPLSSNIQTVGSAKNYSLNQFELQQDSIAITLQSTIQNGDLIRYIVVLDNGFYTTSDTVEQTFGRYTTVLQDNGNQMTNWQNSSGSNWGVTTTDFYTPTGSITDSRVGNYQSNQNTNIELIQTIDLSTALDAQISFWAKWDIDNDYDYVQLLAAGDDGVFYPLCGTYTNLGTNYQIINEPLYDGQQSSWVLEGSSLQDYLGDSAVQVKFQLVSDAFVEGDGFYFDDFTINVLDPLLTTKKQHLKSKWTLEQSIPNPANNRLFIPFSILETDEENTSSYLQIMTPLGQVMYQQSIFVTETGVDLDVSAWEKGVYFYQIITGDKKTRPLRLVVY